MEKMRYLVCYATMKNSSVKVIAEFQKKEDAIEYTKYSDRLGMNVLDLNTYKVIEGYKYSIEELTKIFSEEDAKNIIAVRKKLKQRIETFARRYDQ